MKPHIFGYLLGSVDGRIAWFANDFALIGRYYEIGSRWKSDAILVGSNTFYALGQHEDEATAVEAPPPAKNPPPPGTESLCPESGKRPLVIVPDSKGRIHNWRMIQAEPWFGDIVVICSEATPRSYLEYLDKRHIAHLVCGETQGDLPAALEILAQKYGIDSIRTDCGGKLMSVLARSGLLDELHILTAPVLAGGQPFPNLFEDAPGCSLPSVRMKLANVETIEPDGMILATYLFR